MATATVAPESVGARAGAPTAWQVARWLTLGLYVVTLLGAFVGGVRTESYADLQSALQRGEVDQVRVEGALGAPHDEDGVQGVTRVRLVWQDGWHRSAAEVWQASSPEELRAQGFGDPSGAHVIGNLGEELRRISSGVEVVRAELPSGIYGSFGGWEVRGVWAYLPLCLLGACLAVIAGSPQPRLATRAAWVWLALSPALVVAAPAYLILGARGQIPGHRRLNGIVAFLIFVLLLQ